MSFYFTNRYVFFMLLVLAFLFFMFNKKKLKKIESFSVRVENPPPPPDIDPKNDVYYKRNNNIPNIESRCFSEKTVKYIWKKRWNKLSRKGLKRLWHKKFELRKYKNFSTPEVDGEDKGKLMLKNNAAKCRKKCKNDEKCHGYSIRYKNNEAIRCLLHYGKKGITQICGRDNMVCLQKNAYSNNDNNIKCNNTINKNDVEDEEDDQDIHISTFNKLTIYRDLFDKLDSVAAFKDKFIYSQTQPDDKDIHNVKQCGNRCITQFMDQYACFGFIFNSKDKKCTILEKKPPMK
jgi:hypothetical protein